MNNTPLITILMATYNGERYIEQQLDSLLAQTYLNWNLLIRDDGSTDKTVEIIQRYIAKHKNVTLMINNTADKGACANFSALFELAGANEKVHYVMFCDQDDIWKPEKLEISLSAMLAMEAEFPMQPVLIYSDFELMDSKGDYMPGSFKLKHTIRLKNLLSFNFVYGCTTLMNRALINRIGHIPADAINHDYWVALVASIYKSKYIHKPLLRYRQHGNNASGNVAGNNGWAARLKRNLFSPDKEINNLAIRLSMFNKFFDHYGDQLPDAEKKIIKDYLSAFKKNRLQVCYTMLNDGIFRNGFFQTLSSFSQVLFFFKKLQAKARF